MIRNALEIARNLWDSLAFRVVAIALTVATVPAYFLSCAVEVLNR